MSLSSEVLDYPARPLRVDEVTPDTLNEDTERCPADACGECGKGCICAPCHCETCIARTAFASRPAPITIEPVQLVLL